MKRRWKQIDRAIERFQSYLASSLSKFTITEGFDLRDPPKRYERDAKFAQPGVYLIFDDASKLLWVGSATATMRRRVLSHHSRRKFRAHPGRWVDIIQFPRPFFFLVSALEAFLIMECEPLHNDKLTMVALNYKVWTFNNE